MFFFVVQMFCIALFGQSNSICKLPINWSETDSAMELDSSEMYIPNFMCMNDSSIVLSYPSCFEAISYEITNKAYGIVKRNTLLNVRTISISNLIPGAYILRIQINRRNIVSKCLLIGRTKSML